MIIGLASRSKVVATNCGGSVSAIQSYAAAPLTDLFLHTHPDFMADWGAYASGVVGSSLLHAVGAVALLVSLGISSRDPGERLDNIDIFDASGPPSAFFEVVPDVPKSARVDAMWLPAECAAARTPLPPALIGPGQFAPSTAYERAPRLCVRIGSDGHVLAARVLRSSGRRGSDRALEDQARRLLFQPALRDGRAVAATVTIDVIAGGTLGRQVGTEMETLPIGIL